ncbi:MAG: DUF1501 domain-containing protein [Pirellulaceae bacterium]
MKFLDDVLNRRAMMRLAAWQSFGVGILSTSGGRLLADDPFAKILGEASGSAKPAGEETAPKSTGKRRLIYIFNAGGASHIDTFDPKPGTESQGPLGAIDTSISGIKFGQSLPKLAAMADRLAVVRSMTTETGDHAAGSYTMRTGYKEIATTRHPGIGRAGCNVSRDAFIQRCHRALALEVALVLDTWERSLLLFPLAIQIKG